MTAFLRHLLFLFNCAINVTFQIILVYSKKDLMKLQLPNYTAIHQIMNNGQRGGCVVINVHDSLGFKIPKKQSINGDDMECACIGLIRKNVKNVIVSRIYRPPRGDSHKFLN